MSSTRSHSLLIGIAIVVGAILQLSSLRGTPFDLASVWIFAWGMAPYFVLLAVPRLTRGRAEVIAAVITTCVPDFALRIEMQSSRSGTAALGLMFIPFWILVFFLPLGVYGVRFVLWIRGRLHA